MRLLNKQEITVQKEQQRALDIKEGLKLARRVDGLRETMAQEEESLQKFRRETLANIHEEITTEVAKRDDLKKEVYDLEKRKKDALAPLTEELDRLEAERQEMSAIRGVVAIEQGALEAERKDIARNRKLARDEQQRAATERERSSAGLLEAERKLAEATKLHQDAHAAWEDLIRTRESSNQDILARDIHMAARERTLTMKEESLKKKTANLAKSWKLLRDRQAMLKRATNKLKKT